MHGIVRWIAVALLVGHGLTHRPCHPSRTIGRLHPPSRCGRGTLKDLVAFAPGALVGFPVRESAADQLRVHGVYALGWPSVSATLVFAERHDLVDAPEPAGPFTHPEMNVDAVSVNVGGPADPSTYTLRPGSAPAPTGKA